MNAEKGKNVRVVQYNLVWLTCAISRLILLYQVFKINAWLCNQVTTGGLDDYEQIRLSDLELET